MPKTPPRRSMRTSPEAARSITEPMKKFIPTGTPSIDSTCLRNACIPEIKVRVPRVKGIRSAAQSKVLVWPSLRRAVSHAVVTR